MEDRDAPLPWTERRLIGVERDRWTGKLLRGLKEGASSAVDKATSAVKATTDAALGASAVGATGGTAAALATGNGAAAAAAAGKAAVTAASATATATSTVATATAGVVGSAATASAAALGGLLAAPAMPAVAAVGAAGALGAGAWQLLRENLEGDLQRVSLSDCAPYDFPPGHPLPSTAYVLHPLSQTRYLTLGDFHATLFSEKRAALAALLTSLGARGITATVTRGHRKAEDFATAGVEAADEAEVVWTATLPPSAGVPRVPTGCGWLDREPAWQDLARRRMQEGIREAEVTLRWTEDLGVHQDTVGTLRRLRWKAGEAVNFAATEWRVVVRFS